jgi:hypothetical protein
MPIPISVNAEVPEGATVKGPGWIIPKGVHVYQVTASQLVVCAAPGTYTIEYKLRWLHIVPITFKDFDGKEVTFQNYLGSDDVEEKATFQVVGGEVPPVPPPTPVGQKWAIIWEPAERTAANAQEATKSAATGPCATTDPSVKRQPKRGSNKHS